MTSTEGAPCKELLISGSLQGVRLVAGGLVMFRRGRRRWLEMVLVVILCYTTNIKLQMDRMGRGYVLECRDQDRKLRNNLLYTAHIRTIKGLYEDLIWG